MTRSTSSSLRRTSVPLHAPTAPLRPLGRILVMDLAAIVDDGNRPAKSVVDEDFDITATVFGES